VVYLAIQRPSERRMIEPAPLGILIRFDFALATSQPGLPHQSRASRDTKADTNRSMQAMLDWCRPSLASVSASSRSELGRRF
jgi:hypothetical protein